MIDLETMLSSFKSVFSKLLFRPKPECPPCARSSREEVTRATDEWRRDDDDHGDAVRSTRRGRAAAADGEPEAKRRFEAEDTVYSAADDSDIVIGDVEEESGRADDDVVNYETVAKVERFVVRTDDANESSPLLLHQQDPPPDLSGYVFFACCVCICCNLLFGFIALILACKYV